MRPQDAEHMLTWLVNVSYCASMEKEEARPWRGSLIFTEGKAAKFQNICLVVTIPHMGKIFKRIKDK